MNKAPFYKSIIQINHYSANAEISPEAYCRRIKTFNETFILSAHM